MIIIINFALCHLEACQKRVTCENRLNVLPMRRYSQLTRGNSKRAAHGKCPLQLCLDVWGYSSVVEHSTADREVPGSNPGVP